MSNEAPRHTATFNDHGFMAAHEGIARYEALLAKKGTPTQPAAAMLLTAAREALHDLRQGCPDYLLDVLGLVRDPKLGVVAKSDAEDKADGDTDLGSQ